jgi:hypothetical protein
MKSLLCPNCNYVACSVMSKLLSSRPFPVRCGHCKKSIYPRTWVGSLIVFFGLLGWPFAAVWGAKFLESWWLAFAYIPLLLIIVMAVHVCAPFRKLD